MIWRRRFRVERPLLIVADERRYRDARDQDASPNIPEYYDMLSDPFAAGRISDPRDDPGDDTNFDQANVSAVNSLTAGAGLRQATTGIGRNPDPRDVNLALTDIRYDAAGDNILVDVALTLPAAPDNLTAEVQAGQVTLRWAASNDPTVSYRYRYRPDTMLWSGWSMTTATENGRIVATIEAGDLINNTAYTFEVAAVNGLGRNSATLTATPQALGPSAVNFVEDVTPDQDDTPAVATYTVAGLGNTPNWTLEDDTRNAFELQGTGTTQELHFRQPPDFETLQDATYSVTIQARAGQVTVTQAVSVTVVNAEEAGTVVVMPTTAHRVGEELTATLTDPDGDVSGASWRWHRRASDTMEWVTIQDATAATYSLVPADVGYVLQATVSYTDGHGSNKSAESAPVLGLPSAPQEFEAVAGNGEVALRWQPPALDGGSPIDVYKVLYFSETQPNTDKAGFSAVSGGSSARDTTIKGLTNGTRYVFRVAAHNEVGNGDRAEAKATPQVPCQLMGATAPTFAENATGAVGMYTASAGCDSALSWGLAGTDARFFELKGDGMSRTLEFDSSHSPPNFEQPADAGANNTYAVSVSIGDASVSVTVSVTDANDAGVISLSTTAPRAEESLTATLSDEDGIAEPVYWTPHYESTSDRDGVTGPASEATQTWTLTIPNSRVGQSLRLQADYTDSFGAASATSALTSPVRPAANRAPSVSGPASVDIAENSPEPWLLGTYIGRDPDGDELAWSITGTDASAFELKEPASPGTEPSRELHLANAADYEAQARYDVWVKVSDAVLSDSLRVSVSVVNQNEDGSVVLTGGLPPEVGTAVVAGLTDPDGQITGASWQWQRRLGTTGAWEAIGAGVSGASSAVSGAASAYPELSSYTPVSGDVGWQLQATVRYRDGHDPNTERMSASAASAAVFGPPAASVTAGWGRIRVEWPAVASATSYDVQGQGKPFDRGPWPAAWSSLATNITALRYAHRGVSPDSLYRYQVRSRTDAAVSEWSDPLPDAAGVQPGVDAPTGFRAAAGAGQVTLRWTGPEHASIIKWRYRDVTAAGADTDGDWQDATVSGSASTEWVATVEGLTPGREYRFQVRAVNGAGGGRPSAVSNTVTPWLARPTGGSVSVQAGPALKVAWSAVASATGYEVEGQSKPYDGGSWPSAWTTQQAHGAQPYVHPGVDADRRYRYRVRARVGETVSAWSDTLPGVAGVQPPPGAPTGLTATPGIRQATLRWTGPTHTSITEWQYKRGQILEPITAWGGWLSMGTAATTRSFTVRHPLVDGGSYRFEVRARNGGGWSATTRTDTVTLPVDTKGRVALSTTTPQVGDALTAMLTDPDNPTDVGFTWAFFLPAGVSGANGADPPPSAVQSEPLRVSTVHLGLQIRARVSYADDYGRQQAQSPKTSAVVGPPWVPRTFTAMAGDGQVALAWEVPLKIGGSAITSYQYRYKKTSGSWPENWTSAGTATSATVTDLTNGTPYSFAVRAVNGYGDGTVAGKHGGAYSVHGVLYG